MEEHICKTCGKTFPECGRGRRCVDGYCVIWIPKTISQKHSEETK